jgi:hypothetical protein
VVKPRSAGDHCLNSETIGNLNFRFPLLATTGLSPLPVLAGTNWMTADCQLESIRPGRRCVIENPNAVVGDRQLLTHSRNTTAEPHQPLSPAQPTWDVQALMSALASPASSI